MTCRASYVFWSKERSFAVSCLLFRTLASVSHSVHPTDLLSEWVHECVHNHTHSQISISSLSLNLIYLLAYIVAALVCLSGLGWKADVSGAAEEQHLYCIIFPKPLCF